MINITVNTILVHRLTMARTNQLMIKHPKSGFLVISCDYILNFWPLDIFGASEVRKVGASIIQVPRTDKYNPVNYDHFPNWHDLGHMIFSISPYIWRNLNFTKIVSVKKQGSLGYHPS